MPDIHSIEFEQWIDRGVKQVFETMFSIPVNPADAGNGVPATGDWMVASVNMAGRVSATVNLWVNNDFARQMTIGLMGFDASDPELNNDIHDVIGEVCNMIGGNLKSRLCDAGLTCEMSIPVITAGSSFRIEAGNWERRERYGFRNMRHPVLVELFIRSVQ